MPTSDATVTGALERIAARLGALPLVPSAAQTDEREELIVRYTMGGGTITANHKIAVKGKMFKLNGEPDGEWEGVDDPVVPLVEIFNPPPQPREPFDKPAGPVDEVKVLSYSKGIWRFGDGSTITAIGPAQLRVIFYVDGASQLWVSAEQIITNGTGRFAGAQGLKTVGGSSWVKRGQDPNQPGDFSAKTVEVFRIIRREFIGQG